MQADLSSQLNELQEIKEGIILFLLIAQCSPPTLLIYIDTNL